MLGIEWRQPASNFVSIYEFTNFEALWHQQLRGRGLPRAVRSADDDNILHLISMSFFVSAGIYIGCQRM